MLPGDRFVFRTEVTGPPTNQKKGPSRVTILLRQRLFFQTGHRHLELGLWCRDKGLVAQASMQFIAAVEASEHRHPGAERVLSIMRSLGEWIFGPPPNAAHLSLYG